jgi:hypothetical protein
MKSDWARMDCAQRIAGPAVPIPYIVIIAGGHFALLFERVRIFKNAYFYGT